MIMLKCTHLSAMDIIVTDIIKFEVMAWKHDKK